MRKVIVHYHLFKNAGSSVDQLLKLSFGDKWHAFDPVNPSRRVTAQNLTEIIESMPEHKAFSSHCIVPPLPEGDFEVFPIVVLRDPIARVMSAYSFEWKKQLGLDKAKGTLTEYIQEKFSKPRANAIEDFQTLRLSVTDPSKTSPVLSLHSEQIFSDAKKFVARLPAFGIVEDFSTSLDLWRGYLLPHFPDMKIKNMMQNVTQDTSVPIYQRHEKIKETIGTDTYDELVKRNQLDIKLYAYALGRFEELKLHVRKDSVAVTGAAANNTAGADAETESNSVTDVNKAEAAGKITTAESAIVDINTKNSEKKGQDSKSISTNINADNKLDNADKLQVNS